MQLTDIRIYLNCLIDIYQNSGVRPIEFLQEGIVMGCSNGHPLTNQNIMVDSRVPFSQMEIEDIQSFWDIVKRRFEDTAMEYMIRFFRAYPHFQLLFPTLREIPAEDFQSNADFVSVAISVFAIYDDVIEHLNRDVDTVLAKLEDVARIHAKVDGFQSEFFQYMEEPFIEAFREKIWEHFHEQEEELMRRLFVWICQVLTLHAEPNENHLVHGD